MVRNASIGLVAFLAGLLTAYALSHSATTLPEVPVDQLSLRFDALDEALASLDRNLRIEASPPEVGLVSPLRAEPAGNALAQEIALMRDELHGLLEALEARQGLLPAAEGREDAPGSAANYEAQQRSWAVLDGALAARRWTREDAQDLLASWSELSPPEQQEILATLFAAANRGEIEMDGVNLLF